MSARLFTVQGPADVINGFPLKVATNFPFVFKPGLQATQGLFFFFELTFLSGSESNLTPLKNILSPTSKQTKKKFKQKKNFCFKN